ncbi:MAG: threonine synthase [Pseudomonadota bacterium]
MEYVSTRGAAGNISFLEAILSGLAPDGGLYVPTIWPEIPNAGLLGSAEFPEIAARVLAPFAGGDFSEDAIRAMAERAFGSFDHPSTTPLRKLSDGTYLLELFHGPTLAFKDVAMQLLSEFYSAAIEATGDRKTIIGATSGDTGGAAIHAFADKPNVEVFMLHPKGRISDVQRRIMTTNTAGNIHNIAVDGSFDTCQKIIKDLFGDEAISGRLALSAVNSINWVRLAIQQTYYFRAIAELGEAADFVVPTGNFGDIYAGYVAKKTGLSVGDLIIAVNENDIMHRVIETGDYHPKGVLPTTSPSMDIQVASNFERLLYDVTGRDVERTAMWMQSLKEAGTFALDPDTLSDIRASFSSGRASREDVAGKIKAVLEADGYLVDPHTAVGLHVAKQKLKTGRPTVVLATASPAKFPEAVIDACGEHPPLPERYADLHLRKEACAYADATSASVRDLILATSAFA